MKIGWLFKRWTNSEIEYADYPPEYCFWIQQIVWTEVQSNSSI